MHRLLNTRVFDQSSVKVIISYRKRKMKLVSTMITNVSYLEKIHLVVMEEAVQHSCLQLD